MLELSSGNVVTNFCLKDNHLIFCARLNGAYLFQEYAFTGELVLCGKYLDESPHKAHPINILAFFELDPTEYLVNGRIIFPKEKFDTLHDIVWSDGEWMYVD